MSQVPHDVVADHGGYCGLTPVQRVPAARLAGKLARFRCSGKGFSVRADLPGAQSQTRQAELQRHDREHAG